MTHEAFTQAVQAGQIKSAVHYDWVVGICKSHRLAFSKCGQITLCKFIEYLLFFMMVLGWAVTPFKWYITTPVSFLLMIPVSKYKESIQQEGVRYIIAQAIADDGFYYRLVKEGSLVTDGRLT